MQQGFGGYLTIYEKYVIKNKIFCFLYVSRIFSVLHVYFNQNLMYLLIASNPLMQQVFNVFFDI